LMKKFVAMRGSRVAYLPPPERVIADK
jgi:hypothetical protein